MREPISGRAARKTSLQEMRSEYISMAIHEFRTPITAITSSIELLETKMELDALMLPFYRRNLSRIKEEITLLNNMVDDILISGSMVSGSMVARPEATDVVAFVGMVRRQYFHQRADKRQLSIRVSGARRHIYIDQSQLTGILTNLVGNAFKYSQGQGPLLRLHYGKKGLYIKVKDTGIGIPEKDIPFLFTPFFRGRNVGSRTGAGLGLAIVKRFVMANNGTIAVSSDAAGTVFTLMFPYVPDNNPGGHSA